MSNPLFNIQYGLFVITPSASIRRLTSRLTLKIIDMRKQLTLLAVCLMAALAWAQSPVRNDTRRSILSKWCDRFPGHSIRCATSRRPPMEASAARREVEGRESSRHLQQHRLARTIFASHWCISRLQVLITTEQNY